MKLGTMKIELNEISIREVAEGFVDSAEKGCRAYGGKLNVRPAYQREFIYKDAQRKKVIESIKKNFPLNVMYWIKTDDGNFEMLDGQQRTISICQYLNGDFSFERRSFANLPADEKNQILDYKLMIYICSGGSSREKLDWFKIVNLAGAQVNDQEMRNAVYPGSWLTDAKKYFSKKNCPAAKIAADYMKGSPIRQDYLETVLKWIAKRDKIEIEDYMNEHAQDPNAGEIWLYFKKVIDWIELTFPTRRKKIMQGQDWGIFYNEYGNNVYDAEKFDDEIKRLLEDDDVTRNSGIYAYLLDRNEKHLSIRKFSEKMRRAAYERQNGICAKCGNPFDIKDMQADHITPWSKGGKTVPENCQMLCADCNRRKSNK